MFSPGVSLLRLGVACVAGIVVLSLGAIKDPRAGSDFNQFYSAAQLSGSGLLYDWDSLKQVEVSHGGMSTPYGRLPVYAGLFRLFAVFPYQFARVIWLLANVLALLGFVCLWPAANREHLLLILCWSYPAAKLLSSGQDTAFFLLFISAGFRLLHAGRRTLAGIVLSFAVSKFHLALAVPLFIVARRDWRALWGGTVGCTLLLGASFALEGAAWPGSLFALSRHPEFSPAPYKMPNLHGLSYWFPYSGWVEIVLGCVTVILTYLIVRNKPFQTGASVTLAAGLLLSHHAYAYDAVSLIPLLVLVDSGPFPPVLKFWAAFLCLPLIYLLLFQPASSFVAQTAITSFSLVLLVVTLFRRSATSNATAESVVGSIVARSQFIAAVESQRRWAGRASQEAQDTEVIR
jgi:hypothetical protein